VSKHYDAVVIGTGPGGESAAMNINRYGKRVAVIESGAFVGGACTHLGTIPSKALRHSVTETITYNSDTMFRSIGEPKIFTFEEVLQRASEIIRKQVEVRAEFYARNQVDLYFGHARFVDKNTLSVKLSRSKEPKEEILTADNIVIATGSHPYRPDNIDFDHPRIYCSDKILSMTATPRSLIVYGAGVIGCEYASIFAGLRVGVDLINNRSQLLSFLDDEISDALSYQLRKDHVVIRHNEEYDRVETTDREVLLHLKSGKVIRSDALLWCNGRTGNTADLGLENIGLEGDSRGQLKVNENFQTSIDNVYALGDVIGWPSLASASYNQGACTGLDILGKDKQWKPDAVPTGIYTIPEISSIGKTERELTEAQIPYETGHAFFKDIARAQITGQKIGMLKLLFHSETLEILGIHCFGDQAAEILHIGQAIMRQKGEGNNIRYFITNTFNYPTMAEAYRSAAYDGLRRVRYIPSDKISF